MIEDDPRAQLRALREDFGVRVADCVQVRATGRDAASYLNRMTSQKLDDAPPGRLTRTLVLTPQGRIVGAPRVWVAADAWTLDFEPSNADAAIARLERTVIADDVVFERAASRVVHLVGPRAEAFVRGMGVEPPPPGAFTEVSGELPATRVGRREGAGSPEFLLTLPATLELEAFGGSRTISASIEMELPPGAEVSRPAWDALRVLERRPSWGAELDHEILPLEARLEDEAISFTKGCYPGQEPVVMARHRGHPPTLLVRLRVTGGQPGAALLADGRKVGRLTTVTDLAGADEPNALGFVRYALAAAAPTLQVEGGGEARVLEGEGP